NGRRAKLPPGPRGLPILGSLPVLGSNPHQSLYTLSKRYGGLMYLKIGTTPAVIASSLEAATAILKTFDNNFCNRAPYGGAAADILLYDKSDITMSSNWPMLRKLCVVHLLSPKCVDEWLDSRDEEMAVLLASIFKQRAGSAVNVGDFVTIFTSNVISQMMMKMRIFEDNNEEAAHFRDLMDEFLSIIGGFRIEDYVPFLGKIGFGASQLREMKNLHKRIDEFLGRNIREHSLMPTNEKKKDFVEILEALKSDSHGELSDANIKGILLNMFSAGTDTATRTVEWAMSELIRHPHIMKRLREEIDSEVGVERRVKECDLPRLKYLTAVVTETLRLHPPTPLMLPHASGQATTVLGHFIPQNTRVMVNVWAIARDPNLWERPLEFDPDRFVGSPVNLHGTDFRVIPFGAGRRMCPGHNLGLRMVSFALASFIHAFEWTLPAPQNPQDLDMSEKYEISIHRKVPLDLFATPRLPAHLYLYNNK
ncbi:hypothetical protein KI387_032904, partial [Taxus chinensis]